MRASAPPPGRWAIAWAGAAVMLTTGTIYSWGMFTQPLQVAFQWDLTTTTWTYTIANFSLAAVGTLLGGFWQDRAGPRSVALIGIGLWGCAAFSVGCRRSDRANHHRSGEGPERLVRRRDADGRRDAARLRGAALHRPQTSAGVSCTSAADTSSSQRSVTFRNDVRRPCPKTAVSASYRHAAPLIRR